MDKILIFIPTYNERDNITALYQEIKKLPFQITILFCDDNSPDGTGSFLDELAAHDAQVKVIHRPAKLGLGTAHKLCFEYAYHNNFDYLLSMDADFTHDPCYIPDLLAKKDEADIVIGSRYIAGGGMQGWNRIRLPFTYFWRNAIKYGLGLPYDSTGAFRLYKVKILVPEVYNTFKSKGFAFGLESLYRLKHYGAKITEVPICARNRKYGESKLS